MSAKLYLNRMNWLICQCTPFWRENLMMFGLHNMHYFVM
jgi:hypothetical protein